MPAKLPAPKKDDILGLLAQHHPNDASGYARLKSRLGGEQDPQDLQRASWVARLRGDADAVGAALALHAHQDQASEAELQIIEAANRILDTPWDHLGGQNPEGLRRMVVAMAADARVLLVVLAERVLLIESMKQNASPEQRQQIAQQSREIYAPLANRMGVWQVKWRLEDLSLRELEPQVYKELKTLLAQTRDQRDAFVKDSTQALHSALQEHHLEATITGRPKHIASIYNKMQRKNLGFHEIYDVTALRVIVNNVAECYAVLGIVHGLWTPISGEFDDYIARPKSNLYQSLHTAVVGPKGTPLEIQIRTQQMHEFAEFGVAAHWAYKEGSGQDRKSDQKAAHQFDLLHQLMDWQKQIEDHESFAQALKTELFSEQVYVFTPKGEVLAFSRGSTPLDFAYRVHTMVGHRCKGAKINGKIVPLQTPLSTGDRVEILTHSQPQPSRDWLAPQNQYVHTASARQKIRQWFREQGKESAAMEGKEIFDRTRNKIGLPLASAQELAKSLEFPSETELFVALGFGDLSVFRISSLLLEQQAPATEPEPLPEESPAPASPRRRSASGVRISGMGEIMSQPANCCKPLPGDPVIGFMTRGRGMILHRRDCTNALARNDPERWVEISWGRDEAQSYPVELELLAVRSPGLLRRISDHLAAAQIEARSIQIRGKKQEQATVQVSVDLRHHDQLSQLLGRLERMPEVLSARRLQN